MKRYRLMSSEMLHVAGLLRWAINGYKFKKDRPTILTVMCAGWPAISEAHWHSILTGDIPHTIDGADVIIEIGDNP